MGDGSSWLIGYQAAHYMALLMEYYLTIRLNSKQTPLALRTVRDNFFVASLAHSCAVCSSFLHTLNACAGWRISPFTYGGARR
jgi:hypothetical protein